VEASGQAKAVQASTTLDVDGRPVEARIGESLAAALTRAGLRSFRETAGGRERGLFCGMGVCQDCLVSIDGHDNRRACMTKVQGPHAVQRQRFPGRMTVMASAPIIDAAALPVLQPDVLVVGGGAGGLSAAVAAAEAGADVSLIDERHQPGGQYHKQPAAHRGEAPFANDAQFRDGRALIERARRAGVEILERTEAWGAFAPMTIGITGPAGAALVRPRRLVVATGAYERGLPVPGWTLPGVMTAGAAQTLLRTDGVLPGRRVLVCGNGPLNLQIALELQRAGAEIVAVAELAPRPGPGQARALWRMASSAPGLLRQGAAIIGALRRQGVPVLHGHVLLRVEREGAALAATLGPSAGSTPGTRFATDAVLMGYGFQPSNELLRALGCTHDFDAARGHLATQRSVDCETSVTGVYAVGDCCGLGGAPAAREEGTIAGAAAARGLGFTVADRTIATARARLERHRRFQDGLWRVFAAPRLQLELADPDTVVCRCEEVTLGAIEAALADGRPTIGEVKRRTRLGMGSCQGRYCAPLLAHALAHRQGRALDGQAFFAPRVPAKPVAIADLVRIAEHGNARGGDP
jgi:NADPH-dependent 2,4-dienoyl-CoA reductase/sulfur reductase-like enzyme